MQLAGALLVVGLAAFVLGALLPPSRAFTGTPTEQLEIVGRHPARWTGSALGLGVGVVLTLAGLSVLHVELLREQQVVVWSVLAIVGFGAGAILFLIELAHRATVMVAVATSPNGTPDWFWPVHSWAGALYWAYMPLAYLSVAATGAAGLRTTALGPILGWTALLFGLVGAIIFLVRFPRSLWTLSDIPGLLYLVTGAMGVELLLRG